MNNLFLTSGIQISVISEILIYVPIVLLIIVAFIEGIKKFIFEAKKRKNFIYLGSGLFILIAGLLTKGKSLIGTVHEQSNIEAMISILLFIMYILSPIIWMGTYSVIQKIRKSWKR